MNLLKRLFGSDAARKASRLPASQVTSSTSSPASDRLGIVGFSLFEYRIMATNYGEQAFEAIYPSMSDSAGTCIFHDGDDLGRVAPQLLSQSDRREPSNPQSAMKDPDRLSRMGLYLVGLWTDDISNFARVHAHLTNSAVPGYLGHLTLGGGSTVGDFGHLMRELALPASIALVNGKLVKGTSKYGVGINPTDHALMLAAMRGQLDEVKRLLDEGADVEYVDPMDRRSTPLFYATEAGHTEIIKLLRKAGARQ